HASSRSRQAKGPLHRRPVVSTRRLARGSVQQRVPTQRRKQVKACRGQKHKKSALTNHGTQKQQKSTRRTGYGADNSTEAINRSKANFSASVTQKPFAPPEKTQA